ncbi:hypothetical protein HMI55_002827 [Coelomomyces lativittatus]|nr:hypothetical protein HMI55_002827 [Coelomomyces lativittatus]
MDSSSSTSSSGSTSTHFFPNSHSSSSSPPSSHHAWPSPSSPTPFPPSSSSTSSPHVTTSCLGRVKDLSQHVPKDWWTYVFNDAMYLQTDGDVVEDPEITLKEVEGLEKYVEVAARLKTEGTRVLDLCCGQGRHALMLAQRYPQLEVYGHDQSEYLIGLAQQRAHQQGVDQQCHFTVGDCRTLPYPSHFFDLILILGNSFGYFASATQDVHVLQACYQVAKPNSWVVLDITDGAHMKQHFQPRTWEWIDEDTFVCRERALTNDRTCLVSREVVTKVHVGVIRDQFYCERLYERHEILNLLSLANYHPYLPSLTSSSSPSTNASTHSLEGIYGDPITVAKDLSKRKEDLGMMEYRMIMIGHKQTSSLPPVSLDPEDPPSLFNPPPSSRLTPLLSSCTMTSGSPSPLLGPVSCSSTSTSTYPFRDHVHRQLETTTDPASFVGCPRFPFPNTITRLILLLGDPSLPCVGKLHDTWNQEDVLTQSKCIDVIHSFQHNPPPPHATHMTSTSVECHVLQHHASYVKELTSLLVNPSTPSTSNPHASSTLVLNFCDEGWFNQALLELHVPAYLDVLQCPYSGAGPTCLGVCYDKGFVNSIARGLGIATPQEFTYFAAPSSSLTSPFLLPTMDFHALMQSHQMNYPLFIKPIQGDNSLGIDEASVVENFQGVQEKMNALGRMHITEVMVQEYLMGQEYSVGVLGNPCTGYVFLPVLQVHYEKLPAHCPPILGYASKWDPSSPYWSNIHYGPCHLPPDTLRQLQATCTLLFQRLGCRDYARFDFRQDHQGTLKLLEVDWITKI